MDTKSNTASLIKHASRLEGQLAALKRELQKDHPDCEKASAVLTAASRSFASLRRSFVECFLVTREVRGRSGVRASAFESLMRVVSS